MTLRIWPPVVGGARARVRQPLTGCGPPPSTKDQQGATIVSQFGPVGRSEAEFDSFCRFLTDSCEERPINSRVSPRNGRGGRRNDGRHRPGTDRARKQPVPASFWRPSHPIIVSARRHGSVEIVRPMTANGLAYLANPLGPSTLRGEAWRKLFGRIFLSPPIVASETLIGHNLSFTSKHNSHSKLLRPWTPCPVLRNAHTSGGGAAHGMHGSAKIARRD